MTNWIQNHILLELTKNPTRRYSELKPRDIEGNLFMYHLKGIMKEGLVEKTDRVYRLSPKGLQFVSTLSLKTGKMRKQPQILNAIIAKNEQGEYLFTRWRRQPNTGLISFPHGMMHYGEGVFAMAALELAEKAGLTAELAHKGDVYVRVMRGDDIDRHMLVHLFEARDIQPGRQTEMRPELGESFWAPLASVIPTDFLPGFYEIAQLSQRTGAIFEEITTRLQS
ncbi:MAG TPA: NUDIX domain-containing protein [Verrucomicrobiae bacterium]|nr:NUDIX domain-containing protein [Verrucomicrobiae bacterium]